MYPRVTSVQRCSSLIEAITTIPIYTASAIIYFKVYTYCRSYNQHAYTLHVPLARKQTQQLKLYWNVSFYWVWSVMSSSSIVCLCSL